MDYFDDERFTSLEARFSAIGKFAKQRAKAGRTVVTKGALYQVFPFEENRHGFKADGRIIPVPTGNVADLDEVCRAKTSDRRFS